MRKVDLAGLVETPGGTRSSRGHHLMPLAVSQGCGVAACCLQGAVQYFLSLNIM